MVQKSFMAIADFMILNGYVAWNMASAERLSKKKPLRKYLFHAGLAEEMINYTDEDVFDSITVGYCTPVGDNTTQHTKQAIKHDPVEMDALVSKKTRCVVCTTEYNMAKRAATSIDN